MRALIHGYFGMGNVGDEAILSVVLEELKHMHIEPIALSANPSRTAKLHGVRSCCDRFLSLSFWRYFLSSSMMVFAGGGRYGHRTLRRMCILAILAKLLGKRVEFRAVGIYPYEWTGAPIIMNSSKPFNDLITRALMRIAFSLADRVTVRDGFSRKVLVASGVSREIGVEEDLAFRLTPSSAENSLRILLKHGVDVSHRPLIGINLRTLRPEVRQKLVDIMSKFLDWLIERGAETVFIPFGYGSTPERFFDDDLIIARELAKHMRYGDRLKIIDVEYRSQEILGVFRFLNLFIGMRFHSIIFSIMMRIPTIALIYDTKTVELLKRKGDRCRCISITVDELNIEELKRAINALKVFA